MNKEEKLKLAVQIAHLEALRAIRFNVSEPKDKSNWNTDKLFDSGEGTEDVIRRSLKLVDRLLRDNQE